MSEERLGEVSFGVLGSPDEELVETEAADFEEEEGPRHPLFPTYGAQEIASFSVMRGAKALETHLDPSCTEEDLMAFLSKRGTGQFRITPTLINGTKGESILRTVTKSVSVTPAPTPKTEATPNNDQSLQKLVVQLRAAVNEEITKARTAREQLEAEQETQRRAFRRELDDQDREHRSFRRKLEDEHLLEVSRLKQQIRDLESDRDNLARRLRDQNDGSGVSQQVRDQIALFKAEAELAPPPSEFDAVLAKGLEVLLPKLAGAFMGGSAASAPPKDWKDPLAAPPPDEQH